MILATKVRLLPTPEQEKQMFKIVGTRRFIYNWTLAKQEENYKNGEKFIDDTKLRKELTKLKKDELKWLFEVSNNVAKQAVKDACNAYKSFFKGISEKPKSNARFFEIQYIYYIQEEQRKFDKNKKLTINLGI